jgi:hypothetical protein
VEKLTRRDKGATEKELPWRAVRRTFAGAGQGLDCSRFEMEAISKQEACHGLDFRFVSVFFGDFLMPVPWCQSPVARETPVRNRSWLANGTVPAQLARVPFSR